MGRGRLPEGINKIKLEKRLTVNMGPVSVWDATIQTVNHPVISDFENMLYSQSKTSICVSLSIA